MRKVLTVAGSDCSGGAGIQADLKTFSAHGVFGMSVVVSVVAENTSRVIAIQDVTPDMIEKQMDAVFEDIGADAVKVGMLSTPSCMRAVAGKLKQYAPKNVVVDPVMYAKNGCPLMDPGAVGSLIEAIVPLADVLTRERAARGPLHGVVHAAGVIDDAPVLQKSYERCARVLAPKIAGAILLDELTAEDPLELFVMMSSTSGILGSVGQSDYSMANRFLDAFAERRQAHVE